MDFPLKTGSNLWSLLKGIGKASDKYLVFCKWIGVLYSKRGDWELENDTHNKAKRKYLRIY